MPFAIANGIRLFYLQFGEGPDMVFIHGLAANRAFWFMRIARLFSDSFRVTLYDLRGHGSSELPPHGYTARHMAADLEGLLDHLNVKQATLVGHSYGGVIALLFAASYPKRVSRLVVADSRVNSLQPVQRLHDGPALTRLEEAIRRAKGGEDWEDEVHVGLRFLEEVAAVKFRELRVPGREEFVPFSAFNGSPRGVRRWRELLRCTTAKSDFRLPIDISKAAIMGIHHPTLLVYGKQSRCLPSCYALGKLLPRQTTTLVPNAGHFHPVTRPRVFAKTLRGWLSETKGLDSSSPNTVAKRAPTFQRSPGPAEALDLDSIGSDS